MVSGAGGWYGTDSRNSEAVTAGTGQIGQLTAYIAGLSGGSWMVGSMMSHSANGNVSMLEIAQKQWNLSSNLVVPDGGLIDTASYFSDLVSEVGDKKDQGFQGQITVRRLPHTFQRLSADRRFAFPMQDYWGLALSAHLFPAQYGPTETPNLTISDLSSLDPSTVPYPIIIAAEREDGEISVSENATVWELTYCASSEFATLWWVERLIEILLLDSRIRYVGIRRRSLERRVSSLWRCFHPHQGAFVRMSSCLTFLGL